MCWRYGELPARPLQEVLGPSSTRLPAELPDRLRVAAPQLRLHQGEIAAAALEIFLTGEGF
jgi:hypothetical protein